MSSKFILSQGAGHKLEQAIHRNGGGATEVEWLSKGQNFKKVVQLASGDAELILKKPANVPREGEDSRTDTLVVIDHSVSLVYPDWVEEPLYPELEQSGPEQYDLSQVELYLEGSQQAGVIGGHKLHDHLCANDRALLSTCLGFRDALAIQKKGIDLFRRFFKGKVLYFWKGVVRGRGGLLLVPCLYERGDGVYLNWRWLGNGWSLRDPAARVASLEPVPSDP